MLEKVVNKDKMRGLGRRDDDGYRRRQEQAFTLPEEAASRMDEAVLSPEYDAMRQIQEQVKRLKGGH